MAFCSRPSAVRGVRCWTALIVAGACGTKLAAPAAPPGGPRAQRISIQHERGTSDCLGFWVSEQWLASPGHCIVGRATAVSFASSSGPALAVRDQQRHAVGDLALLRFDRAEAGSFAVSESLALDGAVLDRGSGSVFTRPRFASRDAWVVRFRDPGSCPRRGDSGAVLRRGDRGRLVVEAMLISGTAECGGEQVALRMDAVDDWIRGVVGGEFAARVSDERSKQ